eukprot:5933912-Prymnesium_polylepis.1
MVSGVDSCVRYASFDDGKTQTVKSTYDSAPRARRSPNRHRPARGAELSPSVGTAKHTRDAQWTRLPLFPALRAGCSTAGAHTRVSSRRRRRSQCGGSQVQVLRETHVRPVAALHGVQPRLRPQPATRTSCRVFYSCECKLRGWVPGPVLNMLQKEALKKATCWVNEESLKEWHASRACASNDKMVRFVENVRESVQNVKLPGQLERGHRAATQFVSNVRSSKARASPFIHAY